MDLTATILGAGSDLKRDNQGKEKLEDSEKLTGVLETEEAGENTSASWDTTTGGARGSYRC